MHVKGFLHKLLSPVIHKSRIKVLSEGVLSAIKTKELVLTKLGRGIELKIQERSGIQKVNRLLGNNNLAMLDISMKPLNSKKVIWVTTELILNTGGDYYAAKKLCANLKKHMVMTLILFYSL